MKITALTTSYPRNSVDDSSIFLHRLYKAIAAQNHDTTVLSPAEFGNTKREVRDQVQICWLRFMPAGRSRLLFGAGLLPNLKRSPLHCYELPLIVLRLCGGAISRAHSTEIVHANWILPGFAAWLGRIVTGRRYVVTLRGSDVMLFRLAPIRWLSYLALTSASAITTVSEELKIEVERYFPGLKGKLSCIQNGVDAAVPVGGGGDMPPLPEKFIVAVGSVIQRKQLEQAIAIIAQESLAGFSLVVCGRAEEPDYLNSLRARAAELGVTERVHFVGAVAPQLIPSILDRAEALITCSSYEGRPNAVLEALALGRPVFASDIPAHRGLIQDGQTGFIVDCRDSIETAAKIERSLADAAHMNVISSNAKASLAGSSWDSCASQYITLFNRILSPSGI